MNNFRIFVIIVTYNPTKWVHECFGSLRNSTYPVHTIVVDNCSTDDGINIIKEHYPEVELIQSPVNLGFGAANNVGIKKALEQGAEFIFLLNQDAYLFKGSIKTSIDILLENEHVGIVSPIHLAGGGVNLDFGFYNYINPEKTPFLLADLFPANGVAGKKYYESEFVNAAAWIVKASVFNNMGGFHPVFKHYAEDHEFLIRLRKNNLTLVIDPQFCIIHDRPQKRTKGEFFTRNQKEQRDILLDYFNGKKVSSASILRSYFKVFLINLYSLHIKDLFLTFSYFSKTSRLINQAKASSSLKLKL